MNYKININKKPGYLIIIWAFFILQTVYQTLLYNKNITNKDVKFYVKVVILANFLYLQIIFAKIKFKTEIKGGCFE